MATIQFRGLDQWVYELQNATDHTTGICKMAVWEGGKVIGDTIRSALDDIPVEDEYVNKDKVRKGIRAEEKAAIKAAFGLSKMRVDGSISTKAGFNPGTKISAVENGTSYMQKHPVVRQAANRARGRAENAIAAKFGEEIMKIFMGV